MEKINNLLINNTSTGICTITLNRPEIHNAFDDKLIHDLLTTLQQLDNDPTVRVVLLAANGKSFSAGADVNWMQRMANFSEQENFQDTMQLATLMQKLNHFSKPTIALVQGATFGGGVGLVACCDIALATPEATFCFSEVKIGLIPAVISPYIIAAIGERAARRYFISAERFTAQEAQRLGLIQQIVTANELNNAGLQLANELLKNSPQAMTAIKQLTAEVTTHPLDEKLITKTAQAIAKIRVSKQGQEGLQAFLQKRAPDWSV